MPVPALEICVDNIESALTAEAEGADRIELCSALSEGGLTPSAGLLQVVVNRCKRAEIACMIRPRRGDFLYSPEEFEIMKFDIDAAKSAGAHAVVFGVLLADGSVDAGRTAELVKRAAPMTVCFHRAFDVCRDPHDALERLVRAGVRRVLTSGQRETALAGAPLIRELVVRAAGRIEVMAGAGITPENAAEVVRASNASHIHASVRTITRSRMEHRTAGVSMGRPGSGSDEYMRYVCDPTAVRAVRAALNETG